MHSPEKQQAPAVQQVSPAEQAAQTPALAPPPFSLTTSSEGEQGSASTAEMLPGTDNSMQHGEVSESASGEGTPWEAPQHTALAPPEFSLVGGEEEEKEAAAPVEETVAHSKSTEEEPPPGDEGAVDAGGAIPPPPAEGSGPPPSEQAAGGEGNGMGADGVGTDTGAVGSGGGGAGFEQAAVALDASSMGSIVKSVASQQPTGMVAAMSQVGGELANAQAKEAEKAQEFLPEIEQPTGLEVGGEAPDTPGNELDKREAPDVKTKETGSKQEVDQQTPEAKGATPADKVATPAKEAISTPESYAAAITSIPEVDGEIDTSAGPRPNIELEGDLDPARNAVAQAEGDATLSKSKGEGDLQTKKDFGEKNILPSVEKEMMQAETEISTGAGFSGQGGALPEMDAQTAAALNAGIMNHHQAEISAELAKQAEGEATYQNEAQAAQEKGLADIEAENEKIKQQQLDARKEGETEINKHRADWTAENEKVRAQYENQSKAKRAEIEGQIQAKVSETNSQIESEYSKAEGQAMAKTKDAQSEIAAKKAEEQQKKKKKSWWQKAIDAVGDFFKKLKEAVSSIFNALRKAVSAIISAVKELAGKLIDMARNAIKGLIDAFADLLKGFIRLALAAFPELAERFCGMIDSVVERVKNAVDALADGLKAAVNFILDGIGSAVNALLSAYESLINGILGALEFLVVGFLKVMEGIANLVKAAVGSPDFFIGQASEELMGQDMTAPLDNEYPEVALPEVGGEWETASAENLAVGQSDPDGMGALLSKDSYTAEDFEVPVLQGDVFDPELLQHFETMGEGEFEFGTQEGDSHGIQALKTELGYDSAAQESPTIAESGEAEVAAPIAAVNADPGRDRFAPDGQGMVGPFSVGERAQFVGGQMLDGIKSWIAEKWPSIVAALIGIIGGAILANILTGGAIMAALPLVMQLLGAYFAADAIMNLAKHFGQYLSKSFPGDIAGGSKSLARGLAIGAIELVFALLFGAKGAFKAAKGAAKSVAKNGVKGAMKSGVKTAGKAAKEGVQGTVKAAVQLGKVAKNGVKTAGKNIVKGGKFVMAGVKKGALAGAKTMDDLAQRLGKAFKFDKFRAKVSAQRILVQGHMNPWIDVLGVKRRKLNFEGDMKAEIPGAPARSKSKKFANSLNEGLDNGSIVLTKGKEAEEMKFLQDYLNKNPNTTVGPEEILDRFRGGELMTDSGKLYRPQDGMPRVDAKYKLDTNGNPVSNSVPFDQLDDAVKKQITDLQDTRKKLLGEVEDIKKKHGGDPDLYHADPDYKAKMNSVNKCSHEIGEVGGRDALKKLNGNLKSEFGGHGGTNSSGVYDEVLTDGAGGVHVPEYKGGHDSLGFATVQDAKGAFVRAQQGSLDHIKYTLKSMAKKGGKAAEAAELILEEGVSNVSFSKVRAVFDSDGEVVEFVVKYFNP